MPRRNVIRQDSAESFYHVYVQGSAKTKLFLDEHDYLYFLGLLERYLAADETKNAYGVSYPNFYNKIELVAFCIMPNYFHFLIYQHHQGALASFMRSLMTSYSRYCNTQHNRSGPLFESRYRSAIVEETGYVQHVSRYIHAIPKQWRTYEYSSLPYYLQQVAVSWLRPERVTREFLTPDKYLQFMEDAGEQKKMLTILSSELADKK